jgi:hypothetical protein
MRTTTQRAWLAPMVLFAASLAAASCGGCPSPESPAASVEEWERRLDSRKMLELDPSSEITIKRDVHNLVVSADARPLAQAFHDVMRDSKRHFGLIRVDRKRANVDRPFTMGERFQGRYVLSDAIGEKLDARWRRVFGDLVEHDAVQRVLCAIENQATSDYGEIILLDLDPPDQEEFSMAYAYLEGSPIAGSSTFIVTQLEPGRSRLTQIFLYQEKDVTFATFFASGGLKLHNQVVYSQTEQAASLIGAKIIDSDIPKEYAEL